jgi:hypothetical protein
MGADEEDIEISMGKNVNTRYEVRSTKYESLVNYDGMNFFPYLLSITFRTSYLVPILIVDKK